MSADAMRAALEFIATHDSSDWPERCRNNVKMARAALSEPAVPQQAWQPIETAPKSKHVGANRIEAVYLLGFCPDSEASQLESCVCVVWWEPLMNKGRGQWYGEGMYPMHPTHWMPLPSPPAAHPKDPKP